LETTPAYFVGATVTKLIKGFVVVTPGCGCSQSK